MTPERLVWNQSDIYDLIVKDLEQKIIHENRPLLVKWMALEESQEAQ